MKTAITTRTRNIEVRVSTAPALVGYAASRDAATDAQERLRAAAPAFVGTPRRALAFAAEIRREIGQSTYARVEFSRAGELVDRSELEQLVFEADC